MKDILERLSDLKKSGWAAFNGFDENGHPICAISDAFHTIQELRRDISSARSEVSDVCVAIGSVEFMDPPDGGDVSVAEQVRRLLQDRNEWRELAKQYEEARP